MTWDGCIDDEITTTPSSYTHLTLTAVYGPDALPRDCLPAIPSFPPLCPLLGRSTRSTTLPPNTAISLSLTLISTAWSSHSLDSTPYLALFNIIFSQ